MSLFSKKAKKSKIQNFVQIEKNYFGKKFFHEVLILLGESMFKTSAKLEMVTGHLVDSYKKPLLITVLSDSF
jgi:hypothetical protein